MAEAEAAFPQRLVGLGVGVRVEVEEVGGVGLVVVVEAPPPAWAREEGAREEEAQEARRGAQKSFLDPAYLEDLANPANLEALAA